MNHSKQNAQQEKSDSAMKNDRNFNHGETMARFRNGSLIITQINGWEISHRNIL